MNDAISPSAPLPDAAAIAKEYEDFAYIVSHDLSAPLRHIKEFSRLLIDGRQNDISQEEQSYVRFIETSLHKVEEMQKALLDFSRIDTDKALPREVDLNQSVLSALKSFEELIDTRKPSIECGHLPVVMGNPKQIELLFFHLLGNALKFHPKDARDMRISVNCRPEDSRTVFEIRDNGIGIDAQYHQEVFRMFRRLDPEQYEGIGAGLSIARKIALRHGGFIRIESEAGKGTSIFFALGQPRI